MVGRSSVSGCPGPQQQEQVRNSEWRTCHTYNSYVMRRCMIWYISYETPYVGRERRRCGCQLPHIRPTAACGVTRLRRGRAGSSGAGQGGTCRCRMVACTGVPWPKQTPASVAPPTTTKGSNPAASDPPAASDLCTVGAPTYCTRWRARWRAHILPACYRLHTVVRQQKMMMAAAPTILVGMPPNLPHARKTQAPRDPRS